MSKTSYCKWESENITQSSSAKPKEVVSKPIHSKKKTTNKQKTKQNKQKENS